MSTKDDCSREQFAPTTLKNEIETYNSIRRQLREYKSDCEYLQNEVDMHEVLIKDTENQLLEQRTLIDKLNPVEIEESKDLLRKWDKRSK